MSIVTSPPSSWSLPAMALATAVALGGEEGGWGGWRRRSAWGESEKYMLPWSVAGGARSGRHIAQTLVSGVVGVVGVASALVSACRVVSCHLVE